MIQSGKFDSSYMDIKKIANSVLIFAIKRLIEISGVIVSIIGVLLFIALISYSPTDPNFIFPENTQIKNLLGFQGSFISDLFFQSFGFIAYLISFTYIITGINIFRLKEFFLIVDPPKIIAPGAIWTLSSIIQSCSIVALVFMIQFLPIDEL